MLVHVHTKSLNLVILASSIVLTHLHFKIEYKKDDLFLVILFMD